MPGVEHPHAELCGAERMTGIWQADDPAVELDSNYWLFAPNGRAIYSQNPGHHLGEDYNLGAYITEPLKAVQTGQAGYTSTYESLPGIGDGIYTINHAEKMLSGDIRVQKTYVLNYRVANGVLSFTNGRNEPLPALACTVSVKYNPQLLFGHPPVGYAPLDLTPESLIGKPFDPVVARYSIGNSSTGQSWHVSKVAMARDLGSYGL